MAAKIPDGMKITEHKIFAETLEDAHRTLKAPKLGEPMFANSKYICTQRNYECHDENWFYVTCVFRYLAPNE